MVKSSKKNNVPKYILSIFIITLHFMPIYILLTVSFKSPKDLSSRWVFPGYLYLKNFQTALGRSNFGQALINTAIIAVIAVVGIAFLGAITAYPLARNKSRFNKFIKGFIMGVMMVPPLSILVPLYSMLAKMNGISTYWGIIIVLITFQLPTSIYLYSNFISAIPVGLEEAASIDGCGPFKTFLYIIMPQLKPVTASVAIITGINCWNNYQFALYLLQSPKMRTVTLAISGFFSQDSSNVNGAAAAALLGISPVIVLFLLLQKYFIQGTIDSALK